jgi:hypothetical protein
MNSRDCAEIVRELRDTARHTTNRRLARELNKFAEMWDEIREITEEIEKREFDGHAAPDGKP